MNHPLGYVKPPKITTAKDFETIQAVSDALDGLPEDAQRFRQMIEQSESEDKLQHACEIAVAFIRWSQDLKHDKQAQRMAGYL